MKFGLKKYLLDLALFFFFLANLSALCRYSIDHNMKNKLYTTTKAKIRTTDREEKQKATGIHVKCSYSF